MSLQAEFDRLLQSNRDPDKYDIRYEGGWVEVVNDAMKSLDPSKDWMDDVVRVLAEEAKAGNLGRLDDEHVDWDSVEARIRSCKS